MNITETGATGTVSSSGHACGQGSQSNYQIQTRSTII